MELQRRTVPIRGRGGIPVPITVAHAGQGPLFVFLHGLVGLNEHWDNVVSLVQHRIRCALVEVPLLQLSGEDCSIDGVVELTAGLLRQEGLQPAVLVGNSFGGHVAARLAIDHPDLVEGLVLAGASGLIEKSIVSDIQIHPSREWLSRKIAELFYDPQAHMRESDLDRAHRELSSRQGRVAMVRLSKSARRNHLGDRMAEIRCPTLLIWGREDVVTPPDAAEGFHARLADSHLVWLERCGHAPMMEQPGKFAELVLDFQASFQKRRTLTTP